MMKPIRIILPTILALVISSMSFGSNKLIVQNSESPPKSPLTIMIAADNDNPFNAFQFDLKFPEELKWIENGVRLTGRTNGHSVSAAIIEPGRLRVIAWSSINADFSGTTGNIFEIDFTTGVIPGNYPVTIQNATLSGTNGNILTGVTNGTFSLKAPQINLSATVIDWGRIPLLQEAFRTLTLTNTGNLPLTINALGFADGRFSNSLTLPFLISAGESKNIEIRFYSSIKGNISSKVTVTSNDVEGQKVCNLTVVAFAVNEIHIGTETGRSGYEVTVPLSINNMEPFNAFQVKIKLPAVAKFIKGSEVLSVSRKDDHLIVADTSKDILTLVAYSPSNKPFKLNDGVVMAFTLLVEGEGGRYTLSHTEPVISDADGLNSLSASFNGWVEIAAPQMAVSSGEINFGDVSNLENAAKDLILYNNGNDDLIIEQMIIGDNAFIHNKTVPFAVPPGGNSIFSLTFNAADGLNHETILRIRSNDMPRDPTDIVLRARSFFPNELRVSDMTAITGTTDTLFIELFNQLQVSGFQFDIELPAGINPAVTGIFLTERKADHVVVASVISSGKLRVLSYSGSLKSFSGISGNTIGIPIQISGSQAGTFPVPISGVVISDNSGASIVTGYKSGIIKVDFNTNSPKTDRSSGVNIFPNPFDEILNIDSKDILIKKISLCCMDGKTIWVNQKVNGLVRINTIHIKPSAYLLIVETENGIEVRKVLKK